MTNILKIFAIAHTYSFTITLTNANSGTLLGMFTVLIDACTLDSAIKKFDSSINWVDTVGVTISTKVERV